MSYAALQAEVRRRCKIAPPRIDGYRQAYEAWKRYQRYQSLADSALTKHLQAFRLGKSRRAHHVRYLAYKSVAEGWECALNDWLHDMAWLEADDSRKKPRGRA